MRVLRIYADRSALDDGLPVVPLLYPFWGTPADDPSSPDAGRYDRWIDVGRTVVELVNDPADADAVVLPNAWEHVRAHADIRTEADRVAEHARTGGLPFLVFYVADDTDDVPLDGIVLRPSLYRSRRRANEHAMPAFVRDIRRLDLDGTPQFRPYAERPVVGFCGYAPGAAGPPTRWARVHLRGTRRASHPDVLVRARAIQALRRSDSVSTNFVLRDAFWAGALASETGPDYERMRVARQEFVANLAESDYALCARGGGNFSYRLYEAMSAGRIPLFLDTDCVLPFEDTIPWRRLCVWVDGSQARHAAEAVAKFHAQLGPTGFHDLQEECRRVWEEFLSPEGFFSNLHRVVDAARPASRATS